MTEAQYQEIKDYLPGRKWSIAALDTVVNARQWLIDFKAQAQGPTPIGAVKAALERQFGHPFPVDLIKVAAGLEHFITTVDGDEEMIVGPSRNGWECMIDLETWGLPPNGLIVSIGAVMMDMHTQTIVDRFEISIDPTIPKGTIGKMFDIHPGTIMWWMALERDEARGYWMEQKKSDIYSALAGFSAWYGGKSIPTWGNGATFDLVLMRNAYDKLNMECPWQPWEERCYRTEKNRVTNALKPARVAHHTPLADAEYQALHLFNILGGKLADT